MLLALSIKAAFVYAAFSVPVCIAFWFFLPETKGWVSVFHLLGDVTCLTSIVVRLPKSTNFLNGKSLLGNGPRL